MSANCISRDLVIGLGIYQLCASAFPASQDIYAVGNNRIGAPCDDTDAMG